MLEASTFTMNRLRVRVYKDGHRGKHGLELGEGPLSLLIPGKLDLGRGEGSEGGRDSAVISDETLVEVSEAQEVL